MNATALRRILFSNAFWIGKLALIPYGWSVLPLVKLASIFPANE